MVWEVARFEVEGVTGTEGTTGRVREVEGEEVIDGDEERIITVEEVIVNVNFLKRFTISNMKFSKHSIKIYKSIRY